MRSLAVWRADPHVVLAAGAAVVVALEGCYRTWISDAWLLLEAMVAGATLLYAWRAQANLRLRPLLGIALGFHLAWVSLHLGLVEVTADKDSSVVYRLQGNMLLEGDYPRSEYPVGAVLLFALEALLGDGTTRVPNALLMIPFQLAIVAAVWATRTRLSAWLAAFVA
jgi:hypothetical protein